MVVLLHGCFVPLCCCFLYFMLFEGLISVGVPYLIVLHTEICTVCQKMPLGFLLRLDRGMNGELHSGVLINFCRVVHLSLLLSPCTTGGIAGHLWLEPFRICSCSGYCRCCQLRGVTSLQDWHQDRLCQYCIPTWRIKLSVLKAPQLPKNLTVVQRFCWIHEGWVSEYWNLCCRAE